MPTPYPAATGAGYTPTPPTYGYQPYPANTQAQASYNPTYGQASQQQTGRD